MKKNLNEIALAVIELLKSQDLYLNEALQILKQVEIIINSNAKI